MLPESAYKKQPDRENQRQRDEQFHHDLNRSDSFNSPKEGEKSQPRIEQDPDDSEKKKTSSISVKTIKKLNSLKEAGPYRAGQEVEKESNFASVMKLAKEKLQTSNRKNAGFHQPVNFPRDHPNNPQKDLLRLLTVEQHLNQISPGAAVEPEFAENKSDISFVQTGQQHLASGIIDASPFEPVLLKSYSEENLENELKQEKINQYSKEEKLSRYLHSSVAFEGKNLSVEVRRCIMACRAILAKPKVFLSFEGAFDFGKGIEHNMKKVSDWLSDATMIVVTKNTSNLLFYDRLIFLDAGKIIEKGNPRNLINDQHSYLFRFLREVENSDLEFLLQRAKSQSKDFNRAHQKSELSETPTVKSNSPADQNSQISLKKTQSHYRAAGHRSSDPKRKSLITSFKQGIPKSHTVQMKYLPENPATYNGNLGVIEQDSFQNPSPQKLVSVSAVLLPDLDLRLSSSLSNSSGPPIDLPMDKPVPKFSTKKLTELLGQYSHPKSRQDRPQGGKLSTSITKKAAWYLEDIGGLNQEPRITIPADIKLKSFESIKIPRLEPSILP